MDCRGISGVTLFIALVLTAACGRPAIDPARGEDQDWHYIKAHEHECIPEIRTVLAGKNRSEDKLFYLGILAQMKSAESLSLLLLACTDDDPEVRQEGLHNLKWRAETWEDKRAQQYLKDGFLKTADTDFH